MADNHTQSKALCPSPTRPRDDLFKKSLSRPAAKTCTIRIFNTIIRNRRVRITISPKKTPTPWQIRIVSITALQREIRLIMKYGILNKSAKLVS